MSKNWMDMVNDMDETEAQETDFQPLPDGWYEATTSGAKEKVNSSGKGHHLSVSFTIIGPSHEGRLVWGTYNVDNPNETAMKIGIGELKRMMLAAGLEKMGDVSDLDGLTCWIKVGRDKRNNERNVIKAYRANAPDSSDEPKAEAPKPAAKPEAAAAPVRKPWLKK